MAALWHAARLRAQSPCLAPRTVVMLSRCQDHVRACLHHHESRENNLARHTLNYLNLGAQNASQS